MAAKHVSESPESAGLPQPRPTPRQDGLIPTDIADALSAVIAKATAGIRDNEAGSRVGGDSEHVHRMRVATRRIRAYLKAARPVLDTDAVHTLRGDLSALADALGTVRDLDVMIEALHHRADGLDEPDRQALHQLVSTLDAERDVARAQLVGQLDDPSYADMLTELDEAAAQPPVVNPWGDLLQIAAGQWRNLVAARTDLERRFGSNPPDDDFHALRILGKRARYTAELLPSSKASAAFLQALTTFQDLLGEHQDAAILEDRLRQLVADSGDVAAALAAGRVIEQCRMRKVEVRGEYPAAWQLVSRKAHRLFWK